MKKAIRQIMLFISAVAILTLMVSGLVTLAKNGRQTELPDVTCFANPSMFLAQGSWLRLYEADRPIVARLIADGKAEMQQEQSLVCHDFRTGKGMDRIVVSELWWRRK